MTDERIPVLALAYGVDLLIGDPRWFPHPVRAMGVAIHWGERILRRTIPWERLAGVVLVGAVVGMSYAATSWLLRVIGPSSAAWGFVAGVVLLFTCLSTKDLAVESRQVLQALEANDLPLARTRVARIVGRDTRRLETQDVVRATVETIAESTLDGILSPLCYFVLGGVPLAMAYKAVNTLDSMIGHRSARYLQFGWAAAKLDTLANWMPARLSASLFAVAAWLCRYRVSAAWRCAWSHPPTGSACREPALWGQLARGERRRGVGWRDGHGGPVPNAGIPEAAMAGALGIRLGGVNWYEGRAVDMPFMGEPIRPLEPQRIREAIQLMYVCSLACWAVAMVMLTLKGG